MVEIDLSKQEALDDYPRVIQQISFTGNLDWVENTAMFFILQETKEIILDLLQGTVRLL